MFGIRSIVPAAFVAAAAIALSNGVVFGQYYGFASGNDVPYLMPYDHPYYDAGAYRFQAHDYGTYEPDYRFEEADYHFPSQSANDAAWFVSEPYEPVVRKNPDVVPPRFRDSLNIEPGTPCQCSNAGYVVPNPLLPRHDAPPHFRTLESRPPVPADIPPTLNQERDFSEPAPSIPEGLRELAPRDRQAALVQRTCPVTGDVLGLDGTPLKVRVGDRDIFVCCEGCVADLRRNPTKYLPALDNSIERQPESPNTEGHVNQHDHSGHNHAH